MVSGTISTLQRFDFSSVSATRLEKMQKFLKLIHSMSVDIRKQELESQIAQLQCDEKLDDPEGEKIAVLKKQIEGLSKKPLREVALGIDEEYDWEKLANSFNNQHTAEEYRSLWKLIFHPSINKNPLTKIEHMHLQKLAQRNAYSFKYNWDKFAKELNTGRTGFLYYLLCKAIARKLTKDQTGSKFDNKPIIQSYNKNADLLEFRKAYIQQQQTTGQKITKEHIDLLRQTISKLDNKTKIQLYNKYTAILELKKTYIHCKNTGGKLTKEQMAFLRPFISKLDHKTKIEICNKYTALLVLRKAYIHYKTTGRNLTKEQAVTLRQVISKLDNKTKIQICNKYITLMEHGEGRNVPEEDASHLR